MRGRLSPSGGNVDFVHRRDCIKRSLCVIGWMYNPYLATIVTSDALRATLRATLRYYLLPTASRLPLGFSLE